jgi:putative Ig domain-containing protein
VTEYISPSLITAPLEPRHLARMGSLAVDVENPPDLVSNALIVPIVKPTVPMNVFFCWHPWITREAQLLLLVIFAGALGSYLHAIMSLADFIGNRTLKASWFWWYVSRPFLGMAMALVFYAVVRGGFLAGTPADANVVNPFGVVAIGALVGMFSDKAAQKLKQIFDVVFTANDDRGDKLNTTLKITPTGGTQLADATAGMDYEQSLDVSGGTAPYTWSLSTNPTWLNINATSGMLSGLPGVQDVGEVNDVTINVVDSGGASGEATLNLRVTGELSSPP